MKLPQIGRGQRNWIINLGVNLGSYLSELIYNLIQLSLLLFFHLQMSHQTNIISIYK